MDVHAIAALAAEPQFLVIRFVEERGRYFAHVEADTTEEQAKVDIESHTIEVRPRSRPYFFLLVFQVPFLLAEDAVEWAEKNGRPLWITKPERSEEGTSVAMLVFDTSREEQRVSFSLQPAKIPAGGPQPRPIDPTIVSNPPN